MDQQNAAEVVVMEADTAAVNRADKHGEFDPIELYQECESQLRELTAEKNDGDSELLNSAKYPELYQSEKAQAQLAETRARAKALPGILQELGERMEFLRFKSPELQTYLEDREYQRDRAAQRALNGNGSGRVTVSDESGSGDENGSAATAQVDITADEQVDDEPTAFPGFPAIAWRGAFADYRDAMKGTTEASDVTHFAAFWTAAAARLRRRCRFPYGMDLFPNVYLVVFGPTGDRKTTATRGALSLLPDGVPVKVLHGVGSGEGLGDWLSAESAVSVSHLLLLEELSELLARGKWDGATLLSFLTHVFDCPNRYELKFRKNPLNLTEPTLSFLACTTPALFWQHMREVDVHGGFGNRLLYLTGPVKEPIALPTKPDFHRLREAHTALARLDTLTPREVALSPQGRALWAEFYAAWRKTELDQLAKAATERVPAYCLKLAMTYAALEGTLPTVTAEQLRAALVVGHYATKCAELLMSHNRQASAQGRCEHIIRRVLQERTGWLSRRQLWQRVSGRFDSWQFGKAVDRLVAAGEVEAQDGARRGQTLYRLQHRQTA
jgi:hypothetical protein